MISTSYVMQQLRGIWRMCFSDDDWREDLDLSTDGVFNSLWAIALSGPLALLSFAAAKRAVMESPQAINTIFTKVPFSLLLVSELTALVIYWIASIIALVIASRSIDASRNITTLIVAFNWSQLLGYICIVFPAALYGITGNVSLYALAILPVLLLNLMILWNVLRQCLPVTIGMTLLIIGLLTIIQVVISELIIGSIAGVYQWFS